MDCSSAPIIQIASDRLTELEALEANLPNLIQNAILEYKKSNLRRLHEKDKANPENVNRRVKRYAEKHREEINAKRREKRRLQKAAATVSTTQPMTPSITVVNPHGNYVPFD
jgi:DNA repair photolyase